FRRMSKSLTKRVRWTMPERMPPFCFCPADRLPSVSSRPRTKTTVGSSTMPATCFVLGLPKLFTTILRRSTHAARTNQRQNESENRDGKDAKRRHDRLWLHGASPFKRLSQGEQLL